MSGVVSGGDQKVLFFVVREGEKMAERVEGDWGPALWVEGDVA